MTTDVSVADGWGRSQSSNAHSWLWVPAFAGTTANHRMAEARNCAVRHLASERITCLNSSFDLTAALGEQNA
jgi:hypothetical protein